MHKRIGVATPIIWNRPVLRRFTANRNRLPPGSRNSPISTTEVCVWGVWYMSPAKFSAPIFQFALTRHRCGPRSSMPLYVRELTPERVRVGLAFEAAWRHALAELGVPSVAQVWVLSEAHYLIMRTQKPFLRAAWQPVHVQVSAPDRVLKVIESSAMPVEHATCAAASVA